MKHIHESLPRQGSPKFIARIWNNNCLIFYETEAFTKDTKETALKLIQAKVVHFKQENKDILSRGYKICPTKRSRYCVVGVYKNIAQKRSYPAYVANVTKKEIKITVTYSTMFFGEDLALDLAVRMSKTLRLCIDHPELIEDVEEFKSFKMARKNFRNFNLVKAVNEIVEEYDYLEDHCINYK